MGLSFSFSIGDPGPNAAPIPNWIRGIYPFRPIYLCLLLYMGVWEPRSVRRGEKEGKKEIRKGAIFGSGVSFIKYFSVFSVVNISCKSGIKKHIT